ncbi:hypothetical protein OAC27_02555 [Flavobacteriaceae bacterium]|jgi:hypothetical protein|nr:hypothetical protein [Flavobacteriaceae bacterium]MDB9831304.1 hypothetical protein [Flavobacteriaceae bacterium]|tara:strand:+ start:1523 stop:2143 length:621 start_codon:yes stop_codon:yes gene_type:complete
MKKIPLILITIIGLSVSAQGNNSTYTNEKSKTISIGVKAGAPNILSLNGEFVLPILNNHIAPFIDYGSFGLDIEDTETTLKYTEYGLNVYLGNKGKGLYVGAGNGTLKNEFTFNNLTFEENGVSLRGTAKTNLDINTLNLKLGYKTGGTIYFRIEAGYGIGTIPDALNFTATSGGITETFSEDIPAIPGIGTNGFAIGNIGFGLSF